MKKMKLFYIVAVVLLLSSCIKEELESPFKTVKEGMPVNMKLEYNVDMERVVTRAAQSSDNEYRVTNLYVFIFDSQGDVHARDYFEGSRLSVTNGDSDSPTKGTVSFQTTTVNNATIVGIANLTTQSLASAYDVDKEDLDGITSLSELQAFVMKMRVNSIERGATFMMTGYAKDSQGNTHITISADESGNAVVDCTLQLERTDAKVEFCVQSEAGNSAWTNFTFIPKTWSVFRAPVSSLLLPANEVRDADGDVFDSEDQQFEEIDAENGSGSFVFYMPENRKSPKKEITNDDYGLRDESIYETIENPSKPGQIHENTDEFEYANDKSTYVVLTGSLSYTNENNALVNADVRYIIHLGYASGDVNDYETKRNTHYIYTVTVKGINQIVVEVREQKEERPGHEGDVVISTNGIFELDSHYDRALISIPSESISNDMTWAVNTPMSNGVHQAGSDVIENGLEDYKWIKFAINREYNQNSNQYVKYPGDQNYSENYDDQTLGSGYSGHPKTARMWDVHQLIRHLKEEKAKGNSDIFENGVVHITAFIDENLYWDDNNTQNWKISVDKDDRQLHIVASTPAYSPDGNSSLVTSLYTFKQKAIRTVFNVDKPELQSAWGLESVMETGRLVPYSNGAQNLPGTEDKRNGRNNTIRFWDGLHWNEVLNTSARYGLNEGYESAVYACLMRNRDLNGDNEIQSNEVRWYLAAVDQLTDIYLGEYALDEESRLYPNDAYRQANGGRSVYWHYTSSTFENNKPWVIWSEEGATRGDYTEDTPDRSSHALNGDYYAYRCIRNLGLPLEETGTNPEDLIKVTPNGNGSYTIDVTNMNVRSRRTNYEVSPLPPHNERGEGSDNNRPYAQFEVYGEPCGGEITLRNGGNNFGNRESSTKDDVRFSISSGYNWDYYQTANPCPEGYRLPNYREMLIMTSRLDSDDWPGITREVSWWEREWIRDGIFSGHWSDPVQHFETRTEYPDQYVCQTGFSLNGQGPYANDRDGYLWNTNGNFYLQNSHDDVGWVRCVRDLQ